VKTYSSGMYARLGFAVAVHCEPDVLLVDEVLAVGDRGFQVKCFKKMGELREGGTTFIMVSHNVHMIAGFSDWVALLRHGKMTRFDNPFEGLKEYTRLFVGSGDGLIEKLVSRGSRIEFRDVVIGERVLEPGDAFSVRMPYLSSADYQDVELDVAVYDERDTDLYYQATNHAYGRRLDLPRGAHEFTVTLRNLQITASMGRIVIALWSRNRTEQLFWWRIPIEFSPTEAATGKNFLPLEFEVREAR
ncbi:MAG: hypothetical protein ACRETX_14595, partial [Steroidobacteraceae bacterium]